MKKLKWDIVGYGVLIILGIAVLVSVLFSSNQAIVATTLRASF